MPACCEVFSFKQNCISQGYSSATAARNALNTKFGGDIDVDLLMKIKDVCHDDVDKTCLDALRDVLARFMAVATLKRAEDSDQGVGEFLTQMDEYLASSREESHTVWVLDNAPSEF